MFEFEVDLEVVDDEVLPEALEPDEIEEVDMYGTHQEQVKFEKERLRSGSWTPIPPPLRVTCIDDSSSPKRLFRPTVDELKGLKASGLWVVKGEGFEKGEWTVHLSMVKGKR